MFKKENTQKKKVKLQVKEVYKIFGEKPEMALKHVLDGTSKTDLLDKYQHTLGLQNISLDICEGEVFCRYGFVWLWKIYFNSPFQSLDRAYCG